MAPNALRITQIFPLRTLARSTGHDVEFFITTELVFCARVALRALPVPSPPLPLPHCTRIFFPVDPALTFGRFREALVVDDDPAMLRLLTTWLAEAGFQVTQASDGCEALAAVENRPPHFLITDWQMPGLDGIELCRRIRQMSSPHYTYILFLTARSGAQNVIEGLGAGADDFLTKPIQQQELLARLHAGVRVLELEASLSQLATTDSLTGLMSRAAFRSGLSQEWSRVIRHDTPISCVMFDIDFFKRLNDSYGHHRGDELLKKVAALLRAQSRDHDLLCRYGGDEFGVLLPHTTEAEAAAWAERLRLSLLEVLFPSLADVPQISASFGVAERGGPVLTQDDLVNWADRALITAKQAGRDRVICASTLFAPGITAERIPVRRASPFDGVSAAAVMTPLAACLHQHHTVAQVIDFFVSHRVNSAPVIDEEGKLVGILSEKDLMTVIPLTDAWHRPIHSIMTHNVVCYEDHAPVSAINEFLCRVPIRRVVIIKDGKPIGSISRSSLLRWYSNWMNGRPVQDAPPAGEAAAPPPADGLYDLRARLGNASRALWQQSTELMLTINEAAEDLVPHVVGGASRVQELALELLSLAGLCQATVSQLRRDRPSDSSSADDRNGFNPPRQIEEQNAPALWS